MIEFDKNCPKCGCAIRIGMYNIYYCVANYCLYKTSDVNNLITKDVRLLARRCGTPYRDALRIFSEVVK